MTDSRPWWLWRCHRDAYRYERDGSYEIDPMRAPPPLPPVMGAHPNDMVLDLTWSYAWDGVEQSLDSANLSGRWKWKQYRTTTLRDHSSDSLDPWRGMRLCSVSTTPTQDDDVPIGVPKGRILDHVVRYHLTPPIVRVAHVNYDGERADFWIQREIWDAQGVLLTGDPRRIFDAESKLVLIPHNWDRPFMERVRVAIDSYLETGVPDPRFTEEEPS